MPRSVEQHHERGADLRGRRRRTIASGTEPTSWFDPVHAGHASAGMTRLARARRSSRISVAELRRRRTGSSTRGGARRSRRRRTASSASRRPATHVSPEQDRLVVVRVGDRAPPPHDVVHLRPVHVVTPAAARASCDRAHRRSVRGRVVAQLGVLDDPVRDVDPEAGDPPVEPEPEDLVERVAHLLVPPVQVGLLGAGSCAGSTAAWSRPTSTPAPPNPRHPVVRRRAVGPRVGPHVPVAVRGGPRSIARRRTTDARSLVWFGHEVEDHPDPALARAPRRAGRARQRRRSPVRHRGSRRRRSPSRRSARG